jgi:hypothetical protein
MRLSRRMGWSYTASRRFDSVRRTLGIGLKTRVSGRVRSSFRGRQGSCCAKRMFLQRKRFGAPQSSLDHRLSRLPSREKSAISGFAERSEAPSPFAPIGAGRIRHELAFPHQCQRTCGRRLVYAEELSNLRGLKIRRGLENLEDRKLRRADPAVRERFFVKGCRGSSRLAQRGAIAW